MKSLNRWKTIVLLGLLLTWAGCPSLFQRMRNECDDDHKGPSCLKASELLIKGEGGATKDEALGLRYLERACDLKDVQACVTKAVRDKLNAPTPKPIIDPVPDPEDAARRFLMVFKVCQDGNVAACKVVLPIVMTGCQKKVEKMCQMLFLVMRKLCDGGEGEVCVAYKELTAAMCQNDDACACGELGRILFYPRPPVRPNQRKAIELLRVGCKESCNDSCQILSDHGIRP